MTDTEDGYDPIRDAHDSYYEAVAELKRRWLAGESLPDEWCPPIQQLSYKFEEACRGMTLR